MTDEQKEQRAIKREIKRLTEIYKDIEVKKKDLAVGLIENAAFTRIRLKELQQDIAIYGLTELFHSLKHKSRTRAKGLRRICIIQCSATISNTLNSSTICSRKWPRQRLQQQTALTISLKGVTSFETLSIKL